MIEVKNTGARVISFVLNGKPVCVKPEGTATLNADEFKAIANLFPALKVQKINIQSEPVVYEKKETKRVGKNKKSRK